jgi:hypothetical protein
MRHCTMPLPPPPTRKPDNAANRMASSQAQTDLLIKGVLCALIGGTILIAPHVAPSASVRELMAGASVVGWFSTVLGCALVGLYAWRWCVASHRR